MKQVRIPVFIHTSLARNQKQKRIYTETNLLRQITKDSCCQWSGWSWCSRKTGSRRQTKSKTEHKQCAQAEEKQEVGPRQKKG